MKVNFNIRRLLAQRKRAHEDMNRVAECDMPEKLHEATTISWHVNESCQMWCEVTEDVIERATQNAINTDKLSFWERHILPVWAVQVNEIAENANVVCEMDLNRQDAGTVFIVTPESVIKYREMKYETITTYATTTLIAVGVATVCSLLYVVLL